MKTVTLFSVSALLLSSSALADAPATLLGDSSGVAFGGYGGMNLLYGKVWGRGAPLGCAEGALLLNHTLSVGFLGCGNSDERSAKSVRGEKDDLLHVGYGGVAVRYHLFSSSPVSLGLGATVGGAGLVVQPERHHDWHSDGSEKEERPDALKDAGFALIPELSVGVNLTRWARVMGLVNYRHVQGIDRHGFRNSDLGGFAAGVGLHLGWF